MSTNTMTTKFTQLCCIRDGSNEIPWTTTDGWAMIGCDEESDGRISGYWPCYMKFTTPYFKGTSKNIKIKFYLRQTSDGDNKIHRTPLRFAICKSDKYRDMYRKTISSVSEETQIINGAQELTFLHYGRDFYAEEFTIECNKIKPNTTYYLFLWGSDTPPSQDRLYRFFVTDYGSLDTHIITITYYENAAHIDTGSEFKVCECYIDTGDSWKPIVPYIDKGTDWKISI